MKIKDVHDELPTHPYKRYERRKIVDITSIAIHHSATDNLPGDRDIKAFANYHVNHHKWPGIGYHYVIDTDGIVYKTNNNNIISYHVGSHNDYTIGICLVGDFRNTDPTIEQFRALKGLTNALMSAYNVNIDNVKGHTEYEGYSWKKCPSLDMDAVRDYISGSSGEEGTLNNAQ